MSDYGIRISKKGFDVKATLLDNNKKDFVLLSDERSPIVYYAGFVEENSPGAGISYDHNLGKYPLHFLFYVDSVSNPTYYEAIRASATTTTITSNYGQAYLIILHEGST